MEDILFHTDFFQASLLQLKYILLSQKHFSSGGGGREFLNLKEQKGMRAGDVGVGEGGEGMLQHLKNIQPTNTARTSILTLHGKGPWKGQTKGKAVSYLEDQVHVCCMLAEGDHWKQAMADPILAQIYYIHV